VDALPVVTGPATSLGMIATEFSRSKGFYTAVSQCAG